MDARDLLRLTELESIRFHEVAGKRHTGEGGGLAIEVKLRSSDAEIEVRCVANLNGDDAEYRSDVAAVFSLSEPVEVPAEVMSEFVEKVGVMTVYPYLRESIHQTAAKLGCAKPVLKLLRPGDVRIHLEGAENSLPNG